MQVVMALFFLFLFLDLAAIGVLIVQRIVRQHQKAENRQRHLLSLITERREDLLIQEVRRNRQRFLMDYLPLADTFRLTPEQQETIRMVLEKTGTSTLIFRDIHSRSPLRRRKAAHLLARIPFPGSGPLLLQGLMHEKLYTVKLAMANSLIDLGFHAALPDLIDTLVGAPESYRQKLYRLSIQFGSEIVPYLPVLTERSEKEVRLFLINYAGYSSTLPLYNYLIVQAGNRDKEVAREAFRVLLKNYRNRLPLNLFLHHNDLSIRGQAIEALGSGSGETDATRIIPFLSVPALRSSAMAALTNRVKKNPEIFSPLLKALAETDSDEIRTGLGQVFSNRMDYFLYRILAPEGEQIRTLLETVLTLGFCSETIGFLNENHDVERENEILQVVKKVLDHDPEKRREFQQYLREPILHKLGLNKVEPDTARAQRREGVPKPVLAGFLLFSILAFPAIFVLDIRPDLKEIDMLPLFQFFLVRANYYFAYYSFAVNSSYLILLSLSLAGIILFGKNRWIKPESFIMKEGVLPSISIIAPAYGEEATIVESVTALLNMDYPDYEVVVVNDGSTDATLKKVTTHFEMERIDFVYPTPLATNPIRGIYRSRVFPRLTVVDKMNGGKADSLNAGINIARGEFCCGIDADSLLDNRALIEAAAMTLDSENDAVALGGMILPVNGCTVRRGQVIRRGVSRQFLPGFQTMEYIRAFISGRIGWAMMKTVLIISGAFGLFRRQELLDIHGYLTSRERYRRDTVGEDMELVVRLVEKLKKQQRKFAILYAPFALCWTEVPDSRKVLSSQRKRWQRGLIDILYLHKSMIGRPRYGGYGVMGLPYFLVFEVLGPWLEIQGYIFFLLALAMGILDPGVILLVLTASLFFGIFISLGSLIIADRIKPFFPGRDTIRLLIMALAENFGFRQIMSFTRITGYLGLFRKNQGWGHMIRKGFTSREVSK